MSSDLSTFIITIDQYRDVEQTIKALGPDFPGHKFIIANKPWKADSLPEGWSVIDFNDNYGIGAAVNLAVKISSEYMLILEDDWILDPSVKPGWTDDVIGLMNQYDLDVIRFRRHQSPLDCRKYNIFDWSLEGPTIAEDVLDGRKLYSRLPGKWYMQNVPHIRRTSKFKDMKPLVEYDNGMFRDAWERYRYDKEEVAIIEFDSREEVQNLRIGILHPGLFIHEYAKNKDEIKPMACEKCTLGFKTTLEYRNVSWCSTCDKEPKNFWTNDDKFLKEVEKVDQDFKTIDDLKKHLNAGMSVVRLLAFGLEKEVANRLPFNVRMSSYDNWRKDIANFNPDVILTYGGQQDVNLHGLEVRWRARWVHSNNVDDIIPQVVSCYNFNIYREPLQPLVSIYTGAHNSGRLILDAYESLKEQTYSNWEWIVTVDTDHEETLSLLEDIKSNDSRVKVYKIPYTGKIGSVKDTATRLCTGEYLIELDHDDLLLPSAVEDVKNAFDADKLLGFVYSDCAEITFNGEHVTYEFDDYWKNQYRVETFNGKEYKVADTFDIYGGWGDDFHQKHAWFLTVGPNHIRAFRRSELIRLGGYNPNLAVSDDWDLMARFYLYSSCYHLKKFLYIQRFSSNNTQRRYEWNQLIQYNLDRARHHYNEVFADFVDRTSWKPAKPIAFPDSRPKLLTIVVATYAPSYQKIYDLLNEISHPQVSIKVISDGHDYKCEQYVKETAADLNNDDIQYVFISPTTKPAWGHAQRQFAIEKCTTPYMWFVDDDNSIYPGVIDKIINQIESESPDALFVDLDYPGHLVGLPHLSEIVIRTADDVKFQHADTMSMIFRKELAQWRDLSYTGDWTFISEYKEAAKRLSFLGEKAGKYRAR